MGAGFAASYWPHLIPIYVLHVEEWGALLVRPALVIEHFSLVRAHVRLFLAGLWFSLPLLTILVSHEMGHYLTCKRYGIDASPPFFIPFPNLLGTLGAFIRIRDPIRRKVHLFDVGVAGPIAGFVATCPFLLYGLLHARHIPPQPIQGGSTYFQYPILVLGLQKLFSGQTFSTFEVVEHPMFMAAWAGLFVTAFNLLPLAQLDGGHALHAVVGRRQHWLAPPILLALFVMGFRFYPWWVVCVIVCVFYVLGLAHPLVDDEKVPLDRKRLVIAAAVLAMLVASFTPAPVLFGTSDGRLSPVPQSG